MILVALIRSSEVQHAVASIREAYAFGGFPTPAAYKDYPSSRWRIPRSVTSLFVSVPAVLGMRGLSKEPWEACHRQLRPGTVVLVKRMSHHHDIFIRKVLHICLVDSVRASASQLKPSIRILASSTTVSISARWGARAVCGPRDP